MPSTPITTLHSDNTPTTDPIRVTIVLTEQPTTRFYAALHAEAVYSTVEIARAVADQLARIHRQQDELIKVATASPFDGRVVLRMQSALNAVVMTLNASHLPKLRTLAGVKGVYRDELLSHEPPISTSSVGSK